MYFWNTTQLVNDLKNNQVSESEFKNYYLASGILILFSVFLLSQIPAEDWKMNLSLFMINGGLLISWMNTIFKANGGNQGQQFLNRVIALYLPISIQLMVYFIVVILIFQLFLNGFESQIPQATFDLITRWSSSCFDVVMNIVLYWRMYIAVKQINSESKLI